MAIEMIDRAASAPAQHARSVRVVHHHDAVVFFRQVAELRQRCDVAVHGEHAVGNQQLAPRPVCRLLQVALAIGQVLVLENLDRGLR